MRSILAALDWNFNIKRKYKVSKSGEQLYKSKVNVFYFGRRGTLKNLFFCQIDRAGTKMTVVPVKVAKDNSFKEAIFNECIESLVNDSIPQVDVGLK